MNNMSTPKEEKLFISLKNNLQQIFRKKPQRLPRRVVFNCLIIFIVSMISSFFENSSGWTNIVYPVSGLVLGFIFLEERFYIYSVLYTLVSFFGMLSLIGYSDYPLALVTHAITNSFEIMLILVMAKYHIGLQIKVERFHNLLWLGTITILASIFPNLVYATIKILTGATLEHIFDIFKIDALADVVGVVIVMPFILSLRHDIVQINTINLKPYFIRLFNIMAFALYLFVFTRTGSPLLFITLPPILLSTALMGYRGGVIHLIVVFIISMVALDCQVSPFMMIVDSGVHERIVAVQIYLMTISVTTLMFTCLLADRCRLEQALFVTNIKLSEMATTDPLTGLANRRGMENFIQEVWLTSLARKNHMSIVMLDVDRFKLYNDRYGHLAGDDCLKSVADTMKKMTRGNDIAIRYGGEEFMLILSRADTDGAVMVAERLRSALMDLKIPHPDNEESIVTASFGVISTQDFPELSSIESFIAKADTALYRAKRLGRNRVEIARQEEQSLDKVPL